MKAFTDIEQSRKLAEFLPIESADMYYGYILPGSNELKHIPTIGNPIEALEWYNKGYTHFGKEPLSLKEYCIPCWSLAALLDILPETIEDECGEYELKIDMIYKKPEYVRLGDCHHSDFPSWDWDNEELLDNIVDSVIWLNNNGYLRDEKLY